jgi:membrane protease subunit HflC
MVGLMLLWGTLYQVNETEQVIITQFGEPVGGPVTTAGLHLKVPFVQTVRRFEKRILEWDGSPGEIPTLDKRFISVDTTARWRIADPLRYLQSIGDERSAHARLDNIIDSAARDVVSGHLLIQTVRNFSRELPQEELDEGSRRDTPRPAKESGPPEGKPETPGGAPTVPDIAPEERLGRDKLTELIVKRAQENLPNLGIELIDVRIRRINYVERVQQEVYKRMISERQRIAAHYRSEGDGESARIRGEKERELDRVRSEAYRRAQETIGKADAEAAGIYAQAYSRDSEFYGFYQTLEAYKQTLQKNSSLLLTTDSDFYRYLKNTVPPTAPADTR